MWIYARTEYQNPIAVVTSGCEPPEVNAGN